jgi:hypothetical protein
MRDNNSNINHYIIFVEEIKYIILQIKYLNYQTNVLLKIAKYYHKKTSMT